MILKKVYSVLSRCIPIAAISIGLIILPSGNMAIGQDKPRIAVLKFMTDKNTEEEAEAIAEELRADFFKSNLYVVVDRTLTERIFKELTFQQSGITDKKKSAKIGNIYAVKNIVTGKLNRIGTDGWQVSAVMIDAETGATNAAETLRHKGDFFNLLNDKIPSLAQTLMKQVGHLPLDSEKSDLSLLIFPSRFSGSTANMSFAERKDKGDAVIYSELRKSFDKIQLKARLHEDPEIDKKSWSGLFSKKPNEQFILSKSREMKASLAVIYNSTFGRNNRTFNIVMYDVSTGKRYERNGNFSNGLWSSTIREKTSEIAEEYLKSNKLP